MKFFIKRIMLLCGALMVVSACSAQQLAFPHAEGFGRFSKGGRGGDVYHVTNLDDYNPKTDQPVEGSLRYGMLSQTGARTIVFDVSGTIYLKTQLTHTRSFLTIAGQTAPGDGITIAGWNFKIQGQENHPISDIMIRFVRFRLGDLNEQEGDCLSTNWIDDLILDHISASWSIDAIHDLRDSKRFTMQWSIFAESLNNSRHGKGNHAMMSSYSHLYGNVTVHHNLMASGRNRHPTLGGGGRTDTTAVVDFRNNVVYNWDSGTNLGQCRHNIINNYYKPGPTSSYENGNKPFRMKSERAESGVGYMKGNYFEKAPAEFNRDNYTAADLGQYHYEALTNNRYTGTTREKFESKIPFVYGADVPKTDTPELTYKVVLERAGANLVRDAVDARVVAGVKNGTNRIIDSQDQVGGYPDLKSKPTLKDSDRDGMPDEWELSKGLNPFNSEDRNFYQLDKGYTNLEVYLNSLVEHLYAPY